MAGENTAYREHIFHAQDDLALYYREYGDASATETPVLCLAGLTRNCKDFHGLAVHLGRSRRVLCLDYRGRGRSAYDPDPRHYHPRTYVQDAFHLLALANVYRVVVLGTSQGAVVAMLLAVARPAVLAGVVLNDMGPEIDERGLKRIAGYVDTAASIADWTAAIEAIKAQYQIAFPDASDEDWRDMAKRSFREGSDGRIHPDFDSAIAKMFLPSGPPPKLWRFFKALQNIPTLAIRGELSDLLSEATFEAMAQAKPDLVRATVPNRGHAPLLTEPASLKAIDGFLADL